MLKDKTLADEQRQELEMHADKLAGIVLSAWLPYVQSSHRSDLKYKPSLLLNTKTVQFKEYFLLSKTNSRILIRSPVGNLQTLFSQT